MRNKILNIVGAIVIIVISTVAFQFKGDLNEANHTITQLQEDNSLKTARSNTLKEENDELKAEIDRLKKEVEKERTEKNALKGEVDALKKEVDDLKK